MILSAWLQAPSWMHDRDDPGAAQYCAGRRALHEIEDMGVARPVRVGKIDRYRHGFPVTGPEVEIQLLPMADRIARNRESFWRDRT